MAAPAQPLSDAARASQAVVLVLSAITGLEPALFFNETRGRPREALARQLAMYLMHTVLGFSHSDVGPAFGRDRKTSTLAANQVENLRERPGIDAALNELSDLVKRVDQLRSDLGGAL